MIFRNILTAMFGIFLTALPAAENLPVCGKSGSREKALVYLTTALREKNPGTKFQLLLKAVEADPENSSVPLTVFSAAAFSLPADKIPLKELNELWARHPQNFTIARYAAMLNIKCGTLGKEFRCLLEPLLKLTPAQVIALPEIAPRSFGTMLRVALIQAQKEQDSPFIEEQYRRWFGPARAWEPSAAWRDRLATVFAPVLFNAEVQAEIAGNTALYKRMKQARMHTEKQMLDAEKRLSVESDYSDIVNYEIRMHRHSRAMNLARKAQQQGIGNAVPLYFATAVLTGSPEDYEKAAVLLQKKMPQLDTAVPRFKMFLNAGLFAEAEQAWKMIPLKQQNAEYHQLLVKRGSWLELKSKIEQQLNAGTVSPGNALLLLTAAEHLKSVSCYGKAKTILTPLLNDPAVANAVGYVGATLERDLEQGRKLLDAALVQDPENYAYLDSAAWIAYKQKRYADAEKLIQQALRLADVQDGISVILEHAGDIAAAQGKSARHYYELALKYAQFDAEFDREALQKRIR